MIESSVGAATPKSIAKRFLFVVFISCRCLAVEMDLANWMGNLPVILHNTPLTCLAIPGSHDSFSYSITPGSDISPDEKRLQCLGHCLCNRVFKRIIFRWTVTQSLTCAEQLNEGIRYFDFRLASQIGTLTPFVVHGLYGTSAIDVLKQINEFLLSHRTEIVLLDFQHFYEFTEEMHTNLLQVVREIFGGLLCPFSETIDYLVLSNLWQRGHQVIIIYRDDVYPEKLTNMVWPSHFMPTPWPNTMNPRKLIDILENNYKTGRDSKIFYVTQGVLTPDLTYIILHLRSTLERKVAPKATGALLDWVKDKQAGENGINIIIADFIGMRPYNFTTTVLQLNYKLAENLTHNLSY